MAAAPRFGRDQVNWVAGPGCGLAAKPCGSLARLSQR
jgi:hypothetical protein